MESGFTKTTQKCDFGGEGEVKVVNEVEVVSILLRRAGRVKLVFKGVSWSQVHPADFQGMLLDT